MRFLAYVKSSVSIAATILYFILDYFVCVFVALLKAEFAGSFQFGDVNINMLDDVIYSFSAKDLLSINFSYWKRSMKEIAFYWD